MKIHAAIQEVNTGEGFKLGLGFLSVTGHNKIILNMMPSFGTRTMNFVIIFCWDKECKLK
jgi:hypothetical protein